jgi:hypothetical protein
VSQVEETLAWEAEQRPRAVAAAIIAGLTTFSGTVLYEVTTRRDAPSEDDGFISVTEAISSRVQGQEPREPSLLAAVVDHLQDNAGVLWLSIALRALGVALALLVLLYLYRATKARAPETASGMARVVAIIALLTYPLGTIMADGAMLLSDSVANAEEARDVLNDSVRLFGAFLQFIGTFALGLAFVLIALNATRVGLLTRFLGILGIIVGILAVVQIDAPQLIRSLWLILLGAMIAGRTQRPPAWETGRAQPWPSQQQIREARQQAELGTNVPPSEPDAPVAEAAEDQPAAVKRKRKKRR